MTRGTVRGVARPNACQNPAKENAMDSRRPDQGTAMDMDADVAVFAAEARARGYPEALVRDARARVG